MKRVICRLLLCLAVTATAFSSSNTFANESAPCKDDVQKFCKDAKMMGGEMRRCLQKNFDQLSPACKDKHKKFRENLGNLSAACRGDAENLCADVDPGKGAIMRCLKDKKDQLSAACKAQMNMMKTMGHGKKF